MCIAQEPNRNYIPQNDLSFARATVRPCVCGRLQSAPSDAVADRCRPVYDLSVSYTHRTSTILRPRSYNTGPSKIGQKQRSVQIASTGTNDQCQWQRKLALVGKRASVCDKLTFSCAIDCSVRVHLYEAHFRRLTLSLSLSHWMQQTTSASDDNDLWERICLRVCL